MSSSKNWKRPVLPKLVSQPKQGCNSEYTGWCFSQSTDSSGASAAALPEGFFDDPVMDAKARGVAYVDKEEEEWEAFQKEIEAEASVAQNILVEDRTEATVDRQIEEIDEQIEAWQR